MVVGHSTRYGEMRYPDPMLPRLSDCSARASRASSLAALRWALDAGTMLPGARWLPYGAAASLAARVNAKPPIVVF